MRSFFLVSSALLVGCSAAMVRSNAAIIVRPIVQEGRTSQTTVTPYTRGSIQHLLIKLYANGVDQGVSRDLINAQLDNPVVFSNLKPNTTYRIQAYAYKSSGTDPQNLISTDDSDSYIEVTLTNDDRPVLSNLAVKLINVPFDAQATSALSVTPGVLIPNGPESGSSQYAPVRGIAQTFVGSVTQGGTTDGTGSNARFNQAFAVAVDLQNNLYVSDRGNNRIRKVSPAGVVSVLAGDGTAGFQDGAGSVARFSSPLGIAVNKTTGMIYVSDNLNQRIRQITPTGEVSTLVGNGTATPLDGTGTNAQLKGPNALTIDAQGNLYVGCTHYVAKVTPSAVVTTLAGSTAQSGVDGFGALATFNSPHGIAIDSQGILYVADNGGQIIRKITPNREVTTIGGSYAVNAFADGSGAASRFCFPNGLAVDANGYLYIGDHLNYRVRRIAPNGTVTTLAGNGGTGSSDGTGTGATFTAPKGLAIDNQGTLYVTDGNAVRIIR